MAAPQFVHRAKGIWPEYSVMLFGPAAVPFSQSNGECEAFQDVTTVQKSIDYENTVCFLSESGQLYCVGRKPVCFQRNRNHNAGA